MDNLTRSADEIATTKTLIMDPAEFAALAQAAAGSHASGPVTAHPVGASFIDRLLDVFRNRPN